jgi:hypothetical protein
MSKSSEAAIDAVNGDYWGADPRPPIRVRNPGEEKYFLLGVQWAIEQAKDLQKAINDGKLYRPEGRIYVSDLEALLEEELTKEVLGAVLTHMHAAIQEPQTEQPSDTGSFCDHEDLKLK